MGDGNEILEIARTGITGLSRGSDYVLFLWKPDWKPADATDGRPSKQTARGLTR